MFVFKKIAAQFLSPLSLSLELLVIGILLVFFTSRQKTGKALIVSGTAILAFCSYTPTSDILIDSLRNQYSPYRQDAMDPDQLPKLVVVLSGGNITDRSLPVMSRLGYETLIRLIEGIRIYRLIPEGKLLLSGGTRARAIPSAEEMAQLAHELGVNDQDIIIESKSLDTEDQAHILHTLIGNDRFILVTSASHMPRSMALFTKLGMTPIPAPTQSIEERILVSGSNPYFPYSINLQKSELAIHEYLGLIWAKLRNQI